jgi:hypothetical protein
MITTRGGAGKGLCWTMDNKLLVFFLWWASRVGSGDAVVRGMMVSPRGWSCLPAWAGLVARAVLAGAFPLGGRDFRERDGVEG